MKRVALYARLSVSTEQSVSIQRQLASCREYAERRDWDVVLEAVDEGVSGSKTAPGSRAGWRRVIAHADSIDAVIVWKTDRLSRSTLDLALVLKDLAQLEVGVLSVDGTVDTSTAQGRMMAQLMSVLAEHEVAQTSERVKAARHALVTRGRRAGGRPPFGWRNIDNPSGPGKILAHDPERIDVVRELAQRALAGDSVYALVCWLEQTGVLPRPRRRTSLATDEPQQPEKWHTGSVETILRNPVLAGLTVYRGDVLRDDDGNEKVDESVAILTLEEHRRLVAGLDARKVGARPWGGNTAPAILSGLARCGTCLGPLHRGSSGSAVYREYRCANRKCQQRVSIKREALEDHVTSELLSRHGAEPAIHVVSTVTGERDVLRQIVAAINQTTDAMRLPGADVLELARRVEELKAEHADQLSRPTTTVTYRVSPTSLNAQWAEASDDAARNTLLKGRIERVIVEKRPNARGKPFDPTRVRIEYHEVDPAEQARQQRLIDIAHLRFRFDNRNEVG
ncbi:hypothetical protein GCM10022215_15210 [Nocardioides fonticola]|uniref:Recombinase family protein n=1 Tax=Nocardioides fonticola TaxID=450363 RepID=A0ABP7XHJ5_9ACTN